MKNGQEDEEGQIWQKNEQSVFRHRSRNLLFIYSLILISSSFVLAQENNEEPSHDTQMDANLSASSSYVIPDSKQKDTPSQTGTLAASEPLDQGSDLLPQNDDRIPANPLTETVTSMPTLTNNQPTDDQSNIPRNMETSELGPVHDSSIQKPAMSSQTTLPLVPDPVPVNSQFPLDAPLMDAPGTMMMDDSGGQMMMSEDSFSPMMQGSGSTKRRQYIPAGAGVGFAQTRPGFAPPSPPPPAGVCPSGDPSLPIECDPKRPWPQCPPQSYCYATNTVDIGPYYCWSTYGAAWRPATPFYNYVPPPPPNWPEAMRTASGQWPSGAVGLPRKNRKVNIK